MLPSLPPPLHWCCCCRDAVPDSRARAHCQHCESLAREKEALVTRYREGLGAVPATLSEVSRQAGQAAADMAALLEGMEVRRRAKLRVFRG